MDELFGPQEADGGAATAVDTTDQAPPDSGSQPADSPEAFRLQELEARVASAEAEAQQGNQLRQMVREAARRRGVEQLQAREREAFERAQQMDPEEGIAHYKAHRDQIDQVYHQGLTKIQQQQQQREFSGVLNAWSQELANQHGLDDSDRQRLMSFAANVSDPNQLNYVGNQMEQAAFAAGQTSAELRELRQLREQVSLGQVRDGRIARGADAVSGGGGSAPNQNYDAGSDDHLYDLLGSAYSTA